jgi:hypothetical protein
VGGTVDGRRGGGALTEAEEAHTVWSSGVDEWTEEVGRMPWKSPASAQAARPISLLQFDH